MAVTHEPVSSGLSPSTQAQHEVQLAYDFFNRELFDGKLPPCFVSFQRKGSRVLGYFSPARFATAGGSRTDEIALNPRHFRDNAFADVMSTLVHEMVHLWQHHFGRNRPRAAYHNKEWAGEMLRLGLRPRDSNKPSARMTGQRMSHSIIPDGRFEIAVERLRSMLPALTWFDVHAAEVLPKGFPDSDLAAEPKGLSGRRTVYRRPACRLRAESRSNASLICGKCELPMPPGELR